MVPRSSIVCVGCGLEWVPFPSSTDRPSRESGWMLKGDLWHCACCSAPPKSKPDPEEAVAATLYELAPLVRRLVEIEELKAQAAALGALERRGTSAELCEAASIVLRAMRRLEEDRKVKASD